MTGSTGTAVDVLVTCDSSKGRRVWKEGGEKFVQVRPKLLYGRFFRGSAKVWQALYFRHI